VGGLIGRAAELARIEELLDEAVAGRSGALVLLGDAGIGKTALCEAAADAARARAMTVLRACAVEAESELAFAGLAELLLPVADAVAALPSPHGEALAAAVGNAALPAGPQPPFAVAVALLRLVETLSAAAPDGTLLLLDDVHWLDDASLDAVAFAVRRLHAEGVAVLLAARPDPDRGLRTRGLPLLDLGPLADEEAGALLDANASGARPAGEEPTGGAGAAPLAPEPRRRLLDAARGNPLALLELSRSLTDEQRRGAVALPEPLRPSGAVEQAYRAQLAALPPETTRALLLPAADERLTYARIVAAMERAGLPPAALAPAERAGLLVVHDGRLRFRHPLLRATVYHAAPFGERAAAHAALAAVLDGDGDEQVRRAWHRAAAAAGPDEDVAAELAAAGAQERLRGASAAAAHALARAAELTPDGGVRARRRLDSARDFTAVGDGAQALAQVEQGLADAGDDDGLRVELAYLRGSVTLRSGQLDAGQRLLAEAAELAAAEQPVRAAELLLHGSLRHRIVGDYGAMLRDARRARELARRAASAGPAASSAVPAAEPVATAAEPVATAAEVAALAELVEAAVLATTGRLADADAIVARHEPLLLALAPDRLRQEVVATPAHVTIWSERWDRAERLLTPMVEHARAQSAPTALIYPLAVRCQLQLRRGRLPQARADGAEALELAVETRQHSLVAFAAGMLCAVEAACGEEDACHAHAAQSIAVCDAVGATAMGMWARAALGHLELALGRPQEALGPLSACARAAAQLGMTQPSVVQWAGDHVEALVRAGRAEEATEALTALTHGSPTAWAAGALARCRGLLTAGEEGERLLRESVERFEQAGARFEAARSLLCLGERLRRGRQRRAAREPLQAAVDVFEGAGARPWARRAGDELRATGQQARPLRGHARDELTPHEHRVALLVAEGRTNPEVAAELYVTRKTVEHHLSQIYRKLGLRSRTELARELAGELPERSLVA